jgi:hypothetical protein
MHVSFDAAAFVKSWVAMQDKMDAAGSNAWRKSLREAYEVQREYGYQNKTGRLTSSMKWRTWEPCAFAWHGELKTTAPYAAYVDSGTKPHKITAKGGGLLRFFWPKVGAWVAFKSVNHPGFKGAGFTAAAIQKFGQSVSLEVERALSAAASKA